MARRHSLTLGDIAKIMGSGRESQRRRSEGVSLAVMVGEGASATIARAVREALLPQNETTFVSALPLEGAVPAGVDAVVILPGSPEAAAERAVDAARMGIPAAILVCSQVEERPVQAGEDVASLVAYLSAANERVAVDKLCEWLVGACASKSIALAAGIPACRQNVVRSLVRSCALANVGVGVVDLLPGADLPVMAASQARLAFDVAAAYDRRLSASDFGLIAGGVMLAGLGYRSVSRSVSRALPPLAWAVRGGVAFAGTVATGAVARACASGTTPQRVAEAAAGGIGKGIEELSARLSQILSRRGREDRGPVGPGYISLGGEGE
ncbi:MAG: hypothetical protein LIV25_01095 [Olsenella sp.]|nr:hypothetical protein [Olsenella sp.]